MRTFIVINTYAPLDGNASGPYTIDEAYKKRDEIASKRNLPVHYLTIISLVKD